MKVVAIVQARTKSVRLPGKVMKEICGVPMIGLLLKRLLLAKKVNEVVVATSENESDKNLVKYLEKEKYNIFIGSEINVLERYYKAAKQYEADTIIRITADNPLTDPKMVDDLVEIFNKN